MKRKSILFALLNIFAIALLAQTTWEVPSDRNAKLSTAAFTEQKPKFGERSVPGQLQILSW